MSEEPGPRIRRDGHTSAGTAEAARRGRGAQAHRLAGHPPHRHPPRLEISPLTIRCSPGGGGERLPAH